MRPRPPLRARRPGTVSSRGLPALGFPSQSPRDLSLRPIEGDSFHAAWILEQRGQVLRRALLLAGAALRLVTWRRVDGRDQRRDAGVDRRLGGAGVVDGGAVVRDLARELLDAALGGPEP